MNVSTNGLIALSSATAITALVVVGISLSRKDTPDVTFPSIDVEQHIRVVYDVRTGVGLQLNEDVQAVKTQCYDGDPVGKCYMVSCKPPEETPLESSDE